MKLSDKLRYLREVEGNLRGLGRALTQQDMVRAIASEMGATISQSYLSQIESGARPHLTNTTRLLLARFFKVHPGYLLDDPEGYQPELLSQLQTTENRLDMWLIAGAEKFRRDPDLCRALLAVANHEDTRGCLLLLESIMKTPSLIPRLMDALRPQSAAPPSQDRKPVEEKGRARRTAGNHSPAKRTRMSRKKERSA
ncbi:helix-turn-helix domain-containing protein [Silvibacterium acidisoli]|uniref:helix-turn-helix domain-containing protein n=1 Tax=Acidobacteriaceae bacterium ZG23-2 TaxID=2883246 RepID=UPI00406D0EAA